VNITEVCQDDFESVWTLFHEIVSNGETYAFPRDTNKEEAIKIWITNPLKTFVIKEKEEVIGTYFIKANQVGQGKHVCNCGYMVSSKARGKGLATIMCKHSQEIAMDLGFKAMQFNFVASSNMGAIRLWNKHGFETVGCLPKAFNHPTEGFIDAFVMYKWFRSANTRK